jgi:hypothetical protein
MTRKEPSLETLWLQNIEMMDKVQRIDRSNDRLGPTYKHLKDSTVQFHVLTHSECVIDRMTDVFD